MINPSTYPLNITNLYLSVPNPFNFRATVYSHGWVLLAPNSWDHEAGTVHRIERLSGGTVVHLRMMLTRSTSNPRVRINVIHTGDLSKATRKEIKTAASRMIRLNEDFKEFYALCRAKGPPWTRLTAGMGRLFRSPTLFEDIVKTICTTNVQWAGTKSMVQNLVRALGQPFPGDPCLHAFPTPESIAAADPAVLAEARMGYRGPYVQALAQQVVGGEIDLQSLEDPSLPVHAVRDQLLAIKGVGNYAAHTILMLLGHYERLAFDTEMRDFLARKYFQGRRPTEKEAMAMYADWGAWKYLAYWFDIWSEE